MADQAAGEDAAAEHITKAIDVGAGAKDSSRRDSSDRPSADLRAGLPAGGISYSVIKAAHLMESHVNRSLQVEDLSIRQVGVLDHIARHPSSSRAGLARAVLTSPQAAGGLIRRLVSFGYISVSGGGAGLALAFDLTPAGRAAFGRARSLVEASEREMMEGLDLSAVLELDRLLHQIVAVLG